jgi:hypothetical protein
MTWALIVAHPGHELLLHHWLGCMRPVVFALTDGSGGHAQDRRATSRRVICATGAEVGSVFGIASDRQWYEAILAGDRSLFDQAIRQITTTCIDKNVRGIVSDAVELFNPMHDLCNVIARRVADAIEKLHHSKIELLDYMIEREDVERGTPAWAAVLDDSAFERKLAAAQDYDGLAWEVDRLRSMRDGGLFAVERLFRVDRKAVWPETLTEEPFYERFGRRRIADGTYRDLITYQQYVRPMAMALAVPQAGDEP